MMKYWYDTKIFIYRQQIRKIYVRFITKTEEQKVNYAIKRIKIENDFFMPEAVLI